MRILHISSAKTWRGGEQQLAYLTQELQTKKVWQQVFCVENAAMHEYCMQHQIPFLTYRKRSSINPFVGKQIKGICDKQNISSIHTHDAHAHTFAYMAARLWGNTTPIIVSRRVDFPIKKSRLSHNKYNHPSIQKIICVSDAVRQIAAPSIIDTSKLVVVHDGIDLSRFSYQNTSILRQAYQLSPDTILIGNIAAIAPHKDYFTFVDTAEILIQEGLKAHFFIIGADGGEEQLIRNYIQQKGLSKHITLTGFRQDIPQILPELDIFLITSKTEGLGTSILDAMACGVPVVATQAGGIPEIIIDQQTGLSAPVGAASPLAKQVNLLIKKPGLKAKLVANARAHLQGFTKAAMAEGTLNVYEEL